MTFFSCSKFWACFPTKTVNLVGYEGLKIFCFFVIQNFVVVKQNQHFEQAKSKS